MHKPIDQKGRSAITTTDRTTVRQDTGVNRALAMSRIVELLVQKANAAEFWPELYQRALSRSPSPTAAGELLAHVSESTDKRQAWEDILWTLLNSQEFIYQH